MRRRLSGIVVLLAAATYAAGASPGCAGSSTGSDEEPMPAPVPIAALLERHSQEWISRADVHGVYESALPDGTPCIKIMVTTVTPELRAAFPDPFHGHPIVFRETGPVVPRDDS